MKSEFIVIKKSYVYSTCYHCKGSGQLSRTFRQMVFVEDCPKCAGEGRITHTTTEEYPLQDALNELKKAI